jgi:WhiB family redox-sensing transcriptional regulator
VQLRAVSAELPDLAIATWPADAACRGRTRLMYATDPFSERLALAVCRSCPVRAECLDDCRATEDPANRYGVCAGLTATERKAWCDALTHQPESVPAMVITVNIPPPTGRLVRYHHRAYVVAL